MDDEASDAGCDVYPTIIDEPLKEWQQRYNYTSMFKSTCEDCFCQPPRYAQWETTWEQHCNEHEPECLVSGSLDVATICEGEAEWMQCCDRDTLGCARSCCGVLPSYLVVVIALSALLTIASPVLGCYCYNKHHQSDPIAPSDLEQGEHLRAPRPKSAASRFAASAARGLLAPSDNRPSTAKRREEGANALPPIKGKKKKSKTTEDVENLAQQLEVERTARLSLEQELQTEKRASQNNASVLKPPKGYAQETAQVVGQGEEGEEPTDALPDGPVDFDIDPPFPEAGRRVEPPAASAVSLGKRPIAGGRTGGRARGGRAGGRGGRGRGAPPPPGSRPNSGAPAGAASGSEENSNPVAKRSSWNGILDPSGAGSGQADQVVDERDAPRPKSAQEQRLLPDSSGSSESETDSDASDAPPPLRRSLNGKPARGSFMGLLTPGSGMQNQ
jgi:hypothetical protein